jgi:hypothetical protein
MDDLHRRVAAWSGAARFLLCYIIEAHADDAWQMGQPRAIPNHETLEERAKAAAHLYSDYKVSIPCVLDRVTKGCGNPAHGERCGQPNLERLYGAWPLRYLIFCPVTGTLFQKGMPKGDSIDFNDIDEALMEWAVVHGTDEQRTIAAKRLETLFAGGGSV